jgi:RNA recognition motif-containing protein
MKLHIGNIAKSVSDADLKELVITVAEPSSVEIVRDRTGESKGFGFVEFATEDNGRAAITGLDGKELGGQALKVSEAKPRKADAPRPSTQA